MSISSLPLGLFLSLLLAVPPARADPDCARDLAGVGELLGVETMSARWIETTADDGKPLKLSISERAGGLWLEFDKTREGLWAAGPALFCGQRGAVEARIDGEEIRLGDTVPWVVRMGMSGGASFQLRRLDGPMIRVFSMGWEGDFRPGR